MDKPILSQGYDEMGFLLRVFLLRIADKEQCVGEEKGVKWDDIGKEERPCTTR